MTKSEETKKSPSVMPEAWGQVVEDYESTAEKLTGMFVDPLLEAAGECEGRRVLDVATGPGVVALEAAKRGGRVTAVDFADEMIERTSKRLREAGFEDPDCVVCDFESMEFDDGSFDIVVSNLGVMFATNPERAFSELARVLDSGGRLAMTSWTTPKAQGFFRAVGGAMQQALPDLEPPGPPIWAQFSDPEVLADYLEGAGFVDPVVETVERQWQVPSVDWFVEDIDRTSPAVTYLFETLTDDEGARFKECLHELLTNQHGDGSFELDAEAHVARADVSET